MTDGPQPGSWRSMWLHDRGFGKAPVQRSELEKPRRADRVALATTGVLSVGCTILIALWFVYVEPAGRLELGKSLVVTTVGSLMVSGLALAGALHFGKLRATVKRALRFGAPSFVVGLVFSLIGLFAGVAIGEVRLGFVASEMMPLIDQAPLPEQGPFEVVPEQPVCVLDESIPVAVPQSPGVVLEVEDGLSWIHPVQLELPDRLRAERLEDVTWFAYAHPHRLSDRWTYGSFDDVDVEQLELQIYDWPSGIWRATVALEEVPPESEDNPKRYYRLSMDDISGCLVDLSNQAVPCDIPR